MKEEFYIYNVKCNNCDFGYPYDDEIKIPKGIKEKEWSNKTECPKCGCKETLYFYGGCWKDNN